MIVDNALYREGERVQLDIDINDVAGVWRAADQPDDFVWIGLHDPETEEIEQIGSLFSLHPLALEDALKPHQRPKVERYENSLFIVLKTLWYVDEDDAVETGEIAMFVGHKFAVTVRHGSGAGLATARHTLEAASAALAHGPSAVVYTVCDEIVDGYEEVAASLQEDVDEVEASVFSTARTSDAARIYVLKRELAEMRRAVLPLREPMTRFATGSAQGIHTDAGPYFRDVADHLSRVADTIDSLDSLLSTAFDAHIAQISLQQNDDMRRISAAVGLIAAPTLIGSVYGMNFVHMPELEWTYGYPFGLGLMLLSSLAVYVISKRAGWL